MKYLSALAFAAAILSAPAAAEVVETSADHFVTRDEAVVKAAPKAAWLALISPGDWWDDDHTWSGDAANLSITPQGGGCFCERIPEVESETSIGLAGSAQHMTVVLAQPEKVLRMRGALGPLQSEPVDGVLTITLQADKASNGTKIVWEYVVGGHMRFPIEKISGAVDGVMSEQLAHLADKLGRADAPAGKSSARKVDKSDDAAAARPADVKDANDVAAQLDAMEKKDE